MIQTAESVAVGHPDKVCDQVADAVLDHCLTSDPNTRAAVEALGGHRKLFIVGELTTTAPIDEETVKDIANKVYADCGYGEKLDTHVTLVKQSPEIAKGVDGDGAGDQGIMVGYATAETEPLIPLETHLARELTRAMGERDGKAQVTVEDGAVVSFLTSVCGEYDDKIEQVVETVVAPHLKANTSLNDAWTKNPNGPWSIGGFAADTGLTGRKIVVDAYGPKIPVGGGAFSGKDATKVDRSGAYMARKVAADYVRKGAKDAITYIAYAIGQAEPVAASVIIGGKEEKMTGYDLRPRAIIEQLELRKPQFYNTARYGHFGNGYAWD